MSLIISNGQPVPVDPQFQSVTLLLHGNGTNGSTTITDNSFNTKTISRFGNTQISTAQSKFGGASIAFDGSGDYLKTQLSSDFNMFQQNFTAEFWVYFNAVTGTPHILNMGGSSEYDAGGRATVWVTSSLFLSLYTNGGGITSGTTLAINTWYHVALTKASGTWQLWLNGVSQGTTASTVFPTSSLQEIGIGSQHYQTNNFLNGYLDEVRITRNVARYTANFTPPAAAFADV